MANDSLDDLLCVQINALLLQKLDPSYEIKLVNKAVELYMNSSTLKRGRYTNKLLGDINFVGNISSSDSESKDESDDDSQSEVEEESEGFTL